jgi:hypothetical protein
MKERRRRRGRAPWFLLTGFILGLTLGIVYAWLISPVELVDIGPGLLNSLDKDRYRAVIALAYQAGGNLERARQRLLLLKDGSGSLNLAAQAQRLVAAGTGDPESHALAVLAAALSPQSSPMPLPSPTTPPVVPIQNLTALAVSPSATLAPGEAVRTPTPLPSQTATVTATITLTPIVTFAPRYTEQPTATLGAPFSRKGMIQVCDPTLPHGLLQVEVDNGAGQGVTGVRILVTWPDNNQDAFYTGLMPDFGPGYADFVMSTQVTYSVRAGESGQVVDGLSIPTCGSGGSAYSGGWKITFGQ